MKYTNMSEFLLHKTLTLYVHIIYTRNSSGDEIANVNFLYDIVHVLQNTIDLCINSATVRRGGYVLERMFTKFSEISSSSSSSVVIYTQRLKTTVTRCWRLD